MAAALLGGCAVGPDFQRPAPPILSDYGVQTERASGDGTDQSLVLGAPVDASWWRGFGSSELDDLVAAGLRASPTLASARAALDQSRDQARAGAGVFLPSLGGSFAGSSERDAAAQLGQSGAGRSFRLYTLAGQVSYSLDLFGGERRQYEALSAQADYQRHALGAAYLVLSGEIVDAAIASAGYAEQAERLGDIVRMESQQRDLLKVQSDAGATALSAVLVADQQLAADRQALAVMRQRLAASRTLLNQLTGREPAQGAPATPSLSAFTVPASVTASLPYQLVRQRPDILQAEAAMHQASAEVGVATAALLPSISITGDYGSASTALTRLAEPAGRFWSVGPSVDLPVFRGGALWFGRKAAQAALIRAEADYRQTVLAALEQVADQLHALDADAEEADAARRAADAADQNRGLGVANLRSGLIADIDALALDIEAARATQALAAARAQRLQDVVGLYVATGGGWNGQFPATGGVGGSGR